MIIVHIVANSIRPFEKSAMVKIKNVSDLQQYLENLDKSQAALSKCVDKSQIQDQLLVIYKVECRNYFWRQDGLNWIRIRSDRSKGANKWYTTKYAIDSKNPLDTMEKTEYRCNAQKWENFASWTDPYVYVYYSGSRQIDNDDLNAAELHRSVSTSNSLSASAPQTLKVCDEFIEISKMALTTHIVPVVRMENQKYFVIAGSKLVHLHVNSLLNKTVRHVIASVDLHIETIALKNKFMTLAMIKHPLLAGDQLIPISFIFHQEKQHINVYSFFFRQMVSDMPKLNSSQVTLIYETRDRQHGVAHEGFATLPLARIHSRRTHIYNTAKFWLLNHPNKSSFARYSFLWDIGQLLTAKTMKQFEVLLREFNDPSRSSPEEDKSNRRKQILKPKVVCWDFTLKNFYEEHLDYDIRGATAANATFRGQLYPRLQPSTNASDEMSLVFMDAIQQENVTLVQAVRMLHFFQNHKLWAIHGAIDKEDKQNFELKPQVEDLIENHRRKCESHNNAASKILSISLPVPKDIIQPREFVSIFQNGYYDKQKPVSGPLDIKKLYNLKEVAEHYLDQGLVQVFDRSFVVQGFDFERGEVYSVNHINRTCSCGTSYECAHLLAVQKLINIKAILREAKEVSTKNNNSKTGRKHNNKRSSASNQKSLKISSLTVEGDDVDVSNVAEKEADPVGDGLIVDSEQMNVENFTENEAEANTDTSNIGNDMAPLPCPVGLMQLSREQNLSHDNTTDSTSTHGNVEPPEHYVTRKRNLPPLDHQTKVNKVSKCDISLDATFKSPEFDNLPRLTKQNKGKERILCVSKFDLYLKDVMSLKPDISEEERNILCPTPLATLDVSSNIMDAVASLTVASMGSSSLHLICSSAAKQIMARNFFPLSVWDQFKKKDWASNQNSILCLFNTGQWMLIVIQQMKIQKQKITVYSPHGESHWSDLYEQRLKHHVNSLFENETGWLPTTIVKHSSPQDIQRTGLIILDYVDIVVRNECIQPVNEIEKSTQILKYLFGSCLITGNKFKSSHCVICRKTDDEQADDEKQVGWVACTRCFAWYHIYCTKLPAKKDFTKTDFTCSDTMRKLLLGPL